MFCCLNKFRTNRALMGLRATLNGMISILVSPYMLRLFVYAVPVAGDIERATCGTEIPLKGIMADRFSSL